MRDVKGIGDGAPEGWVIEEQEVVLPKGLSAIMEAIRSILQLGRVQTLSLELDSPIRFTRLVPQGEAVQRERKRSAEEMCLGEVARNIHLAEYNGSKINRGPTEIFFDMLLGIEARRLHLSHIGVGSIEHFLDWMGLDKIAHGGIAHLGGVSFVQDKDIPDNRLIFFGSPYRRARIDQITYALTHHMFVPDEDLNPVKEPEDG